jgi:DNA-binding response OmpR family regulator
MPKKILIIEDEQYLLEMYRMKFEQGGYRVLFSDNGEDGLALAGAELPDIILLDIMLPKMDGYEVLSKLRKGEKTKSLKIYVLSNLGQNNEVKRGMELGADGYFVKSNLTPSELFSQVEKIIL